MKLKLDKLDELLNEATTYNDWIDHLTLNMKIELPKFHEILGFLDDDNSNVYFDSLWEYEISYTKNHSKNWTFLSITVGIGWVPYTIFQYLEYKKSKQVFLKSVWSFTLYSTYFRLLEKQLITEDFFLRFLWDEYKTLVNFPISRIDYKIDFFFDKPTNFPEKTELIETRKDSKSEFYTMQTPKKREERYNKIITNATYYKWNIITWWNIGNKTNKSIFLRMYEKIIDSITKNKIKLYDDYLQYENVFRLEGEFRTKFNKYEKENLQKGDKPLPYTYWSLEWLKEKCRDYYWLSWLKKGAKVYQYKENKKVERYWIRNFNDFWWRACKIALQGLNPFIIILNQFSKREKLRQQISKELLKTLLIDFNHKTSLLPLKQKQIWK